jgi:hypothetical protein
MEKMKRLLLFLSTTLLSTGIGAQGFFDGASVKAGFSSFAPDDRVFEFAPWLEEWFVSTSPHANNKEAYICIEKLFYAKRINLKFGLGYSYYESQFPTLVAQGYFDHRFYPAYTVDKYHRNSIALPFSMQLPLLERERTKISIGATIINSFAFSKRIQSTIRFSKKKLEINNTEFNPYIEFQYCKISLAMSYRLVNYNRPDRAIYSVYNNPSSGRMRQSEIPHDFYNPTKVWFIIGYDLSPQKK